jgi:pectinesterase
MCVNIKCLFKKSFQLEKNMNTKSFLIIFLFFSLHSVLTRAQNYDAVVASDGSGTYKTIGEALNNIPASYNQRHIVFVKNGIYNEKIRIDNNFVSLIGESRKKTIIHYKQLKTDWEKNRDYEGPAVVNIHADDIILSNLTIENTQSLTGKDAFVVFSSGTRVILNNCEIKNVGSNSVQLYNNHNGMYYINNCKLEGAVDFVKVCGNAFIENSEFYQHEAIGSLWHGAFNNENEKVVVKNCYFDGVQHFFLGRHHYDAQYYFIDCQFSKRMADKPIYHKTYKNPENNRPYFYGNRYFFFNCHKEGEPYQWYTNNINHTKLYILSANQTFKNKWHPRSAPVITITDAWIDSDKVIIKMNQKVSISSPFTLKTSSGKTLTFDKGRGRDILLFTTNESITSNDLEGDFLVNEGKISPSIAHLNSKHIKTITNTK